MEWEQSTMYQNTWDTAKVIQRGKFVALDAYIRNQEWSQINNLISYLKKLKKKEEENQAKARMK